MATRRAWLFRRHGASGPALDVLVAGEHFVVAGDDPAAAVAEGLRRRGQAGEFEIVGERGELLAKVNIFARETVL